MEKLEALKQEAERASNAFMFAKDGQKLAPLYEAQERARKALNEYKREYYRGGGINGNEIPA